MIPISHFSSSVHLQRLYSKVLFALGAGETGQKDTIFPLSFEL